MKKERRWLKSALAAAAAPQEAMPWSRQSRRRPSALAVQARAPKTAAVAAR